MLRPKRVLRSEGAKDGAKIEGELMLRVLRTKVCQRGVLRLEGCQRHANAQVVPRL